MGRARGRWSAIVGASAPDDDNVVELRAKIRALVHRSFGGSFRALFDHYGPTPGGADEAALDHLLDDAGVGNFITRSLWVKGVMKRVDTNHDGLISWDEFAQIVGLPEASAIPAPATPTPGAGFLSSAAHGAGAGAVPVVPDPIAPDPASGASVRTERAPEGTRGIAPTLDKKQAIGLAAGLFGFAALLVGIRAIGER